MRGRKFSALFESPNNFLSVREFFDIVSNFGVRLHGQDLAVHSEAADVIFRTVLKRCQQSICVLKTQSTQFHQRIGATHSTNGRDGRVCKFNWLLLKHAAETKADHGLPQFMIVIDNCNTVASDTQIRYGIWTRLTQRKWGQIATMSQTIEAQTTTMSTAANGRCRSPN